MHHGHGLQKSQIFLSCIRADLDLIVNEFTWAYEPGGLQPQQSGKAIIFGQTLDFLGRSQEPK